MKQENIKTIYEKISDKTLSFWCNIKYMFSWKEYCNTYIWRNPFTNKIQLVMNNIWCVDTGKIVSIWKKDITKIIWKPIMIWDIFDWQIINSKHSNITEERLKIIWLWKFLKYPLEEQTEECINYIFNLIP